MRIIPAIDLMDGACVRLRQGKFAELTVYDGNPVAVAERFAQTGIGLIHLVDLDGAKAGYPVQADLVKRVAAAVPVPVEVGGGLRTMTEIASYLESGVGRVVLGSVAVRDQALLRAAVDRYGPRVVVGIDVHNGQVAIRGWTELAACSALTLAREMVRLGVTELIYTDITRDGMLSGPDLAGLAELVRESGLAVVASGGIASLADLTAVAATGAKGAIVGKALYDGRVDLEAAVQSLEVG